MHIRPTTSSEQVFIHLLVEVPRRACITGDADLASRPLKVLAPLRRSQTLGPEVTLAPPPRYHLTHPLALHSLSLIIPPVQLGGQSFLYLDHPCTMARSYLPAPFIFA